MHMRASGTDYIMYAAIYLHVRPFLEDKLRENDEIEAEATFRQQEQVQVTRSDLVSVASTGINSKCSYPRRPKPRLNPSCALPVN